MASIKRTKKRLGFTNRLAIYIVLLLAFGLIGGFYLALQSIAYGYTGALMCWTAAFTPIGTVCGGVLCRIVDKSRAENVGPNNMGIKFAAAQENGFREDSEFRDSPPI